MKMLKERTLTGVLHPIKTTPHRKAAPFGNDGGLSGLPLEGPTDRCLHEDGVSQKGENHSRDSPTEVSSAVQPKQNSAQSWLGLWN